jgi:hypothetical protein
MAIRRSRDCYSLTLGALTVTYLLDGRMCHQDNAGHEGVIEAGGVQWMTAGKGIVHAEMPEQDTDNRVWKRAPKSVVLRKCVCRVWSTGFPRLSGTSGVPNETLRSVAGLQDQRH